MSFQNISGNGHIKKILRLALQRRRVPNSLLFGGPEGVGKKKTALVLAKALNCLRETDDSCDVCDNCRAIDNGRFPDVIEIAPRGDEITIDQMPVIKQMSNLKPMIGRKRVFIVDRADKMNEHSGNSILKILEEPPLFSHIILISDNQAFILPTIKSRCQTLNFLPIAKEEIEQALRDLGFEEEKARLMALLVRGNLERAKALDWDDIQQRRQEAWSLFLALIGQEGSSSFLKKFAFQRRNVVKEDLEQTLEFFSSFCRDLLLMKEGGPAGLLFNPDYEPLLRDTEPSLGLDQALQWLGLIDQAVVNMGRNLNTNLLVSSFTSQVIG